MIPLFMSRMSKKKKKKTLFIELQSRFLAHPSLETKLKSTVSDGPILWAAKPCGSELETFNVEFSYTQNLSVPDFCFKYKMSFREKSKTFVQPHTAYCDDPLEEVESFLDHFRSCTKKSEFRRAPLPDVAREVDSVRSWVWFTNNSQLAAFLYSFL